MVPPYLRQLNPEQREAALATDGPILVLAGAGSGKTRTIVHRIVHLIRGADVAAHRILGLTFTNRAAREMRERVAALAGPDAKRVTLSTFHSLGARILRAHGEQIGVPKDFAIYSSGDQLALVKRVLSEEVTVSSALGNDGLDIRDVHARISDWKNRLVCPEDARREVLGQAATGTRTDDYVVAAVDVYPRYEESLRAAGACDFDDLLLLPVRLLREHVEVRDVLWRRWSHLLVDEYQDTNGAQLELARLLAGPRKNLCVVGDDDQSIYAWRGADIRNILDFEQQFPGTKVVILETNYRSTRRILDAANAVIANNTGRKAKRMRSAGAEGPLIDYWEMAPESGRSAEERESEMVAREISVRRFHEERKWKDFAVLYRANHQSRILEGALRQANIPYRVVGGTSWFDRKEVVDAVAYLRLMIRPEDNLALRRIVNYPTRGIGRTTLLRLIEAAAPTRETLWDVMRKTDQVESLGRAQAAAVQAFVETMEVARREFFVAAAAAKAREGCGALREWAERYIKSIGLEATIRAENASDRAAEIRIDNLRDFLASIGTYEEQVWRDGLMPDEEEDWKPPSLAGFLERVTLVEDSNREEDEAEREADRVTLMTLHSAKGLEFSHVFLIGLEEDILPHERSLAEAGGAELDPIAEERRLFYVGITRARHRLTLSCCATRQKRGETVPRQPSRFLQEIPGDLLEVRSGGTTSSLNETEQKTLRKNFFKEMRDMLEAGD